MRVRTNNSRSCALAQLLVGIWTDSHGTPHLCNLSLFNFTLSESNAGPERDTQARPSFAAAVWQDHYRQPVQLPVAGAGLACDGDRYPTGSAHVRAVLRCNVEDSAQHALAKASCQGKKKHQQKEGRGGEQQPSQP